MWLEAAIKVAVSLRETKLISRSEMTTINTRNMARKHNIRS